MGRMKFSLAFLLVLLLLVGVAYAENIGGHGERSLTRSHGGAPPIGGDNVSRDTGRDKVYSGKASRPSTSAVKYRKGYGQPGGGGVLPIGDRDGYDQVIPSEACRKFLDETADLREVFDEKRAAHFKSRYDPAISPEEVADHRAEIHELWRNIEAKNTENCRWVR